MIPHIDDDDIARATRGEWIFAHLFVAAFVGVCLYGWWRG